MDDGLENVSAQTDYNVLVYAIIMHVLVRCACAG